MSTLETKSSNDQVVIVDDDASVGRALVRLLRLHGLHAVAFESERRLLDGDSWRRASCFLIDVRLPRTSGIELARRLAQRGATAPVILMSAYLLDPAKAVAEAGAHAFLDKPIEARLLLETIEKAKEAGGIRGADARRQVAVTG